MSEPILNVEHLTMRFGGLLAVDDLSFSAQRGDITAIIGPNGAGKTTVFNCITGFYKPTVGMIRLTHPDGRDFLLERLIDFRIAKHARVARTFQNIRLFPAMTGLENLLVAQHNSLMLASGYTVIGMLGLRAFSNAERAAIDKAKYWLDRIGLSQRADDPAGDGQERNLPVIEVRRAVGQEEDQCRDREDHPGRQRLTRRADRLDDVVFEDRALPEELEHRDREHGDRNRRRHREARLEREVDRGGAEQDAEDRSEDDGLDRELRGRLRGGNVGLEGRWTNWPLGLGEVSHGRGS